METAVTSESQIFTFRKNTNCVNVYDFSLESLLVFNVLIFFMESNVSMCVLNAYDNNF